MILYFKLQAMIQVALIEMNRNLKYDINMLETVKLDGFVYKL